ncbi:MAG: hypothetical protein QM523_00865 [Candidatus Pacebacteria bacterium]|nr:hypothetical protein [Candidatus Paceibacterota bacterium]
MEVTKIKWEVSPAPTGQYRSFHWRGWPVGMTPCNMKFLIRCADDYVPRNVKNGSHKPLKLSFRDDAVSGSTAKTFKREFATLAELKAFAAQIDVENLRKLETPQ